MIFQKRQCLAKQMQFYSKFNICLFINELPWMDTARSDRAERLFRYC